MTTNANTKNEVELAIYTFRLRFEGAADVALEIGGYWFDAEERLIEGADAVNGKLLLALTAPELRRGRLLIAPVSTDSFQARRITTKDLLAHGAFDPQALFDPRRKYHLLPEIPETLWRLWFIYRRFRLGVPRTTRAAIRSW